MSGVRSARVTGSLLLLAAAACGPAQNGGVEGADPQVSSVSADSRVTMQRLPCFGTCPMYTVEVDAGGAVAFTGERFVATMGRATRTIPARDAAALLQHLSDAGFLALAERYTHESKACGSYHTDAPRVIMTLVLNGRSKTVEHDYGCADAPAALRTMQERVDSVAGVAAWVGQR
jgi:hypothetical protein